jgi:hypothetical protein
MGESLPRARRSRIGLAGLPFAVALAVSASTMSGSLAPRTGQMQLEPAPAPRAPAPVHHDDSVYESSEPVSV